MSRSWTGGNGITYPQNRAGSPFTASLWMKTSLILPINCTTTCLLDIGGTLLMGYQSGTGVAMLQFGNAFAAPTDLNLLGTKNITDGNWHNLVFVGASSTTCFIYHNGGLEASANSTGFPSPTSSSTFWPPTSPVGQFTSTYNGILAELAIWPLTSLNASEIAQIYNGVLPCYIRPDTLEYYIPTYGVPGPGGGEAQYGTSRIAPTVGTSNYSPHPPISQLDIGFPGSGVVGAAVTAEQWTGTWAQSSFANAPPTGYADWSPPTA